MYNSMMHILLYIYAYVSLFFVNQYIVGTDDHIYIFEDHLTHDRNLFMIPFILDHY